MKKFFFVLAVFTAMLLMVGCGGSDDDGYSGGYSGGGSSSGGSYSECSSGDRKCSGSYSYYCDGGYWEADEYCSNGCNSSTGRCNSSSGGGSSSGGDYSECDDGDYKCGTDHYSVPCSGGSWDWNHDEYCGLHGSCDYSTGRCKSDSDSGSGGNSGGGSSSECDYGEYRCDGNYSQRCSGGKWVDDQSCLGVGCNDSTGKCKTQDEIEPCPPKLSASVSGSNVKLNWSYSTSSYCGTPSWATLKYYDSYYGEYKEVESKSASSFKSYTLSVSGYGYYDENAGQTLLKAGVIVENESGSASAQCWCFIDDKNCSCQ